VLPRPPSGRIPRRPKGKGASGRGGKWLELSVEADSEAVEAVSEILARVAPGGTTIEPGFDLVDEGLGARIAPERPATIRAYVPAFDTAATDRATATVSEALGHLQAFGLRPIGDLQTRIVDEADWATAWQEHFQVLHLGRRLVIKPSWRRHSRTGDEVVIDLDPGLAFGTGLHPTTRLCLIALEPPVIGPPNRIQPALDVGRIRLAIPIQRALVEGIRGAEPRRVAPGVEVRAVRRAVHVDHVARDVRHDGRRADRVDEVVQTREVPIRIAPAGGAIGESAAHGVRHERAHMRHGHDER